jgi:RimJ/RimL family protein N-acetyltransferase
MYPKWEQLPQLLDYINTLSAENTFILFSGEQISLHDEAQYLASIFVSMELKQKVYVYCEVGNQLVAVCEVGKVPELKARGQHVAKFGITVAKEFRGEGIGYELASTAIEQAKITLDGLKLIKLECFATNTAAINLYQKLGFVEVGRLPGFLKHGDQYIDEVQMTLQMG